MMTLEEEKRMQELIIKHVGDKADELSKKSGNKYVSWFFRAISTAAAIISVYLMSGCTMHATPDGIDFAVFSPPINNTK